MGLKAMNTGGKKREPIPAGTHVAVCVGYADLGTQTETFQGQTKEQRRVMIFWDIPEERMEIDGKSLPKRISARYTLSLYEKSTLRKMLDAWKGESLTPDELTGFDLDNLINRPAMLQVVHKPNPKKPGEVFVNVNTVLPLFKGIPRPAMEVEPIKYEIEGPTGVFMIPGDDIPRWIRTIISESYEAEKAGWEFDAEADKAAAQQAKNNPEGPF